MPYGMVCFLLVYDCIYPEVVAVIEVATSSVVVVVVELRKGFVKLKDIQV